MKKPQSDQWRADPPDCEGFWWLFGDEEFGTMGGDYNGSFTPDNKLRIVEVLRLGGSLVGASCGRIIQLTPFNKEKRKAGFVGVWQRAQTPGPPKIQGKEFFTSNPGE